MASWNFVQTTEYEIKRTGIHVVSPVLSEKISE
jgi:hypothetical protein